MATKDKDQSFYAQPTGSFKKRKVSKNTDTITANKSMKRSAISVEGKTILQKTAAIRGNPNAVICLVCARWCDPSTVGEFRVRVAYTLRQAG